MTLEEDIGALKDLLPAPERYEKALHLGIEALERELKRRRDLLPHEWKPLPSETEAE